MSKLIPKYQSPWTPINYKSPENFEPKSTKYNIKNTPTILDVQDEQTKQKHAQMSGMRHMLDISQKEPVSGTDPVGEFVVAGEVLGGLNPLGKILFPYAARFTSGPVRNWIASKALNDVLAKDALTGGVNKVVQNNGNILLQLASHSARKPRQLRIEPQGNNSFRVHASTWGGLTNTEKKQLYEALYKELPENAKILFPESNPNYLATRGTVSSLLRLKRDSRFTPGSTLQKLMYKDKDGSIKFFEGTSFTKKPTFNSISYTPNQQQATGETSLAFFERPKSKITESERLGIPKVDRNFVQRQHVANYPGYQLKGLMKGSQLEKQLSKNGTISINQLNAYFNKASQIEKEIANKVLAEKFAGQKIIDYNQFKKAVQDELITYDRQPSSLYNVYGMDRLGFDIRKKYNEIEGTIEYSPGIKTNTFTFENSDKIPIGSSKHYNTETLGHSRTYTTQKEPKILHVLESQSDWGQKKLQYREVYSLPDKLYERHLKNSFNRIFKDYPELIKAYNASDFKTIQQYQMDDPLLYKYKAFKQKYNHNYKLLNRYFNWIFNKEFPQIKHLHNNYLQRQLQENLKYAAENGYTKMRYPTPKTAAKIEGYQKEVLPRPTRNQEIALRDQLDEMLKNYFDTHEEELRNMPFSEMESIGKKNIPGFSELLEKLDQLISIPNKHDYLPEHQTILKKYADFPKLFEKLFKDQKVRTVTDDKENTWFEVDIPKGYLNREWQFKLGGKLIPKQ